MARSRTWVWFAAAVMVAVGLVVWRWPAGSAPPAVADSGGGLPPAASTPLGSITGLPASARALASSKPAAPSLATAGYLAERFADDRTAAFDRLAVSSDPAAQAAAADIADECTPFSDHLFEQTLAIIEKRVMPARIKALQRETVKAQRTLCAGFDGDRIARGARLRRTLAKAGDIRMFALDLPQSEQPIPGVISIAQRAATSGDPLAIMGVGSFFANRNDLPPGTEYDLGDGLAVTRPILRDAFWLAACEYGAECDARSPWVAAKCVGSGWCGSASLEDQFRTYNYSPADAERLDAARQLVLNGLRTGKWPANFWNPRGGNIP